MTSKHFHTLVPFLCLASILIISGGFGNGIYVGTPEGSVTSESLIFNRYFQLPVEAYIEDSRAQATRVADVNGDGRHDVLLLTTNCCGASATTWFWVFMQDQQGFLKPPIIYHTGTYGHTMDVGDFNNDLRLDVAVGADGTLLNYSGAILLQTSTGEFERSPESLERGVITVADFNNDGLDDIASCAFGTDTVVIHLQQLNGQFQKRAYEVTHGGREELEAGDLNGDGRDDVVVMSGQGLYPSFGVLLQNASGTLESPNYYEAPVGDTLSVGVGDVNGDGRDDLIGSYGGSWTYDPFIAVFLQGEHGALDDTPTTYSGASSTLDAVDFNQDGRTDLLMGGSSGVEIREQLLDGTLGPGRDFHMYDEGSYRPNAHSMGDVNSDGKMDVVSANPWRGLVIYSNATISALGGVSAEWLPGKLSRAAERKGRSASPKLAVSNTSGTIVRQLQMIHVLSQDESFDQADELFYIRTIKKIRPHATKILKSRSWLPQLSGGYLLTIVTPSVTLPHPYNDSYELLVRPLDEL